MSQYSFYIILALFTLLVSFVTVIVLSQRRHLRGATALFWSFGGDIGYLVCNLLELVLPSPQEKLMWAKFSYLFLLAIPPAWLAFCLRYTGLDRWLEPRRFFWFCIIPAITFFLVQANDALGLIWTSVTFVPVDGFLVFRATHGQWFWIHVVSSYSMILAGVGLLFRQFFLAWHTLYRKQLIWILSGALLSLGANSIYIFQLIPGLYKDFSPVTFSLSTIAFTIGILQFGLLEIIPVARSVVVEKLQDGVFVLNQAGQIVDVNPAAEKIAGATRQKLISLSLPAALPFCENIVLDQSTEMCTLTYETFEPGARFFDLRTDEINDSHGHLMGWLVSLRDVTERQVLLQKNRELAASDWLTDLYNRRYFEDLGRQELERARRYGRPLSLMMIDLDHFKRVNDTWGHLVGDQVLQEYSHRLRVSLREFDLIARYGGEELVVLLPDTDESEAYLAAERLWQDQQKRPIWTEKSGNINLTVSIGIASLDSFEGERLVDLIERADQAVYRAKARGRNCIVVWKDQALSLCAPGQKIA